MLCHASRFPVQTSGSLTLVIFSHASDLHADFERCMGG
jgi:hypothetical protein